MSEADDWAPVKQAAADDDWQPVGLAERPAPTVGDALPEAFLDRVRQGADMSKTLGHAEGRGVVDKLFGLTGERYQLWPEKMLRSGFTLAHDVASGELQTQVIDPISGEITLNPEMIQRSMDMASFQLGQTHISPTVPRSTPAPLINAGSGQFVRPFVGEDGALSGKTVGGLPTETDFAAAADVLTRPKAGVRLAEAPEGGVYTPDQIKPGEKYFKVVREDGSVAAEVLAKIDGKTANIKDILAPGKPREDGRGTLGPAEMRSVLRQFQEQHPEVEKITGERVSGAQAAGGYDLLGERRQVEMNIRRMWQEDGIHPAEAVHDAEGDAFLKHEITAPQQEISAAETAAAKFDVKPEEMEQAFGEGASLSAAVTPPEEIPLDVQPASPPGSLAASFQVAADKLFDLGRDVQMKLAPMATGTRDSMAMVKDYANAMRRNRWDWSRIDTDIAKRFSPESRARMWGAADEESVSRQLGEPEHMREHQGLATLDPAERALVEDLHARAQNAWVRARDAGMVEGEGLPAYTPRMVVNAVSASAKEGALPLNSIGRDMKTRTGNMLKRKYTEAQETEAAAKAKYGDAAMLARDIRVLPLAVGQLEDAIAGRTLINNIKAYGERTGADTVAEGVIPAGSDTKWFTLDHPAFRTWRPKMETVDGVVRPIKDSAGEIVFEQVPLYVHGDFEGPLRAVLSGKSGPLYQGMMALKGKTMSLIMNSPLIHNAVEFGRAFPAMPTRIVKAYFDGNRAKNNVPLMHEAIDAGLVPIGKRFFNQDINSIMESPDLTPGRSWTAKLLAAVPGLFDEAAGTAVKRAIDKAGDFWHNKLLWDRIADLQMGLYTNFRSDMIAKGIDQQTSSRVAAHLANRYAGALPKEAMSEGATKAANLLLFSRTFTMGNIGVLKDMFTGMPKDVLAQIERDAGTIDPAAAGYAKSLARRKAIATVVMDVGLMYAGNAILQSAFNVMLGDRTLSEEAHGYVKRVRDQLNEGNVNPLSLLLHASPTSENEPGKQDRVYIGNGKDGTAIYARNPVGKIGEEFTGYLSGPLDMLRRKEGTIARPLLQIYSNDKGFGRKIYDPDADTPARYAGNIWNIVKHVAASQLPAGQIGAFSDLVKGEGDPKINALQAFGPIAGVTFAKGAPGGMDVGEMYHAKTQHDYAVNQAMPDIRRQILRGDLPGAQTAMDQLGIDKGYQRWITKTTLNPRTRMGSKTMRDFYNYSTPEQKRRMEGYLDRFGPQ